MKISALFAQSITGLRTLLLLTLISLLWACSSPPIQPGSSALPSTRQGSEVVLFALGLLDTGYRFGGKNPEAGLDCSGMVSYIYRTAIGMNVTGSAADIAKKSRKINPASLRPGDLVFFNTLNRPYSHVGIFIGKGQFVHAPNSRGKVRIDRLQARYYAERFEAAATLLD